MAIYEIGDGVIQELQKTTFADAGVRERRDLQTLLSTQINIISPNTLVISEEFGDWQDSRRRIDLLGLDKQANIVIDTGGSVRQYTHFFGDYILSSSTENFRVIHVPSSGTIGLLSIGLAGLGFARRKKP
jgi:hypothetical protein